LKKSISVVGGDLRIINLVQMLVNDGYTVYSYGLELSEELCSLDGVEMCPTLEEVVFFLKTESTGKTKIDFPKMYKRRKFLCFMRISNRLMQRV